MNFSDLPRRFLDLPFPVKAAVYVALLVTVFVLCAVLLSKCGSGEPRIDYKEQDNRTERIENRGVEQQQQSTNRSIEVISNARNEVEQGRQETNQAMNRDFSNSSLSDAEKARCRAYPHSKGCPKQ